MAEPIEPTVVDNDPFDDGLIYIHQQRTAIVVTVDQAAQLAARLSKVVKKRRVATP